MHMQVAVPSKSMSPVQRWETVVLRAAREGFQTHKGRWAPKISHPTQTTEKEARRAVATILTGISQEYPKSVRASIPSMDCWGSVISLNFDQAWLPVGVANPPIQLPILAAKTFERGEICCREFRRLTYSRLLPGVNGGTKRHLWFPNGSCSTPETVRMGLLDYGTAAHAIQRAFVRLKQWERNNELTSKSPEQQFLSVAAALRSASEGLNTLAEFTCEPTLPLTWVADFLYRPLVFAGVGMSEQETGLWWLLAQRARNTARIGDPPKSFILVNANDRTAFWRNRPMGLEPVVCSNWVDGWEKVLEKASRLNEQ